MRTLRFQQRPSPVDAALEAIEALSPTDREEFARRLADRPELHPGFAMLPLEMAWTLARRRGRPPSKETFSMLARIVCMRQSGELWSAIDTRLGLESRSAERIYQRYRWLIEAANNEEM